MLRKTAGKLFYILVIVLTVISAAGQVIAFPAEWIRPDTLNVPTLLSMIEPFLFVINLILCIILALFLSKWAFVPLIALIISVGHMDSYYPIRFSREYDVQKKVKKPLRLMTYNVRGFKGSLDKLDSALILIEEYDPDILSFVEFSSVQDSGASMIESRLQKLKYHVSNRGLNASLKSENGIVVFSRYPLKNPGRYESNGEGTAVIADAVIDYGDTTRIFAVHFHTTAYNYISQERSLEAYMTDSIVRPIKEEVADRTLKLLTTISQNSEVRSYQADTIRQKVEASPFKTVVMGDLNDTPRSYSVRTVMGDTHIDPFEKVIRNKYGFTYNLLHKIFRIDYILPDGRYYDVFSYESKDLELSDHNPVMVTLTRK